MNAEDQDQPALSEATINDQQSNDQWIMVTEKRPPKSRFILIGNKPFLGHPLLEVQEYDGSINKANWNGKLYQIENDGKVRYQPEKNVWRWRPNKENPHVGTLFKKQYRARDIKAQASVMEKNHLLRKIANLLEQQNKLSAQILSALLSKNQTENIRSTVAPKEVPQQRFSHEHLTIKEVAERLKVDPRTVYMWARTGRLPCIRLSKRTLRFLVSDIDKYEKQHTSSPIR